MRLETIADLLRCPRCGARLRSGDPWLCEDTTCAYSREGFPTVAGKPALIDFEDSVVDRDALVANEGDSALARSSHFLRRIREKLVDRNDEAGDNCDAFLAALQDCSQPRVLVIGGGARGSGTEKLYAATNVRLVGTDIYASPDVDVIADGHKLPFADASFDGVWIQAVLEHVLMPERVVAEIHRVLSDRGVVYAETPFLQPVHERAHDFTRFTRSGHRWLFRAFDEIRSGTIGGPAQSLLWAIRYLGRSLFRSDKAGSAFAVAFFWLGYLDRLVDTPYRADAATGVFFMGVKQSGAMSPRDIVPYFPGVRGN